MLLPRMLRVGNRPGVVLAIVAAIGLVSPARGDEHRASTSRESREEAVAAIPFDELTPEARWKVEQVIGNVSLYRRLPTQVFACDPNLYLYLVNQPDVTVAIWRALGISEVELVQVGESLYQGDDQLGGEGTFEFVYRSPHLHVVYCEGTFHAPVLPEPVAAQSVLLLRTSYLRDATGTMFVMHRCDSFVSIPSGGAEAIARVVSPVCGPMADEQLEQVSLFFSQMSGAMARRPERIEALVMELEGVSDQQRAELLAITREVAEGRQVEDARTAQMPGPAPAR